MSNSKNSRNCKDSKNQKGELGNKMGDFTQNITDQAFKNGKKYSEENKSYNSSNETKNSK